MRPAHGARRVLTREMRVFLEWNCPTLATVALNGARRQFASAPDPAVASSLRKAMEAAACNDAAMRLRLFVENYKTQLKGKTPTRHGCGFVHRCAVTLRPM